MSVYDETGPGRDIDPAAEPLSLPSSPAGLLQDVVWYWICFECFPGEVKSKVKWFEVCAHEYDSQTRKSEREGKRKGEIGG